MCMFTWDICLQMERKCRQERFPRQAISSAGFSSKQLRVCVCFGLQGQHMKRLLYLQWESEFDLSPCERWEGLIPSSDLSCFMRVLESVLILRFLRVRLSNRRGSMKYRLIMLLNWPIYFLNQGGFKLGPMGLLKGENVLLIPLN